MVNDKQFHPAILGTNESYVIDLAAVILKIVLDKRADLFKIQCRCHRLPSCKFHVAIESLKNLRLQDDAIAVAKAVVGREDNGIAIQPGACSNLTAKD